MKLIMNRYLVKEQLVPLTVCLMGMSLILITGRLLELTRYLFTSSLSFFDFFEIILYALPRLALFILPMATLVGVLLGFIRLNTDNELIALRSAGISFRQFLPAVLLVLALATGAAFANTIYLVPAANKAFQKKLSSLGRASLPALLKEGVFIDTIPDMVFFFQKVHPSNLSIKGVFIQDQRQPKVRLTIVGKSALLGYQAKTNSVTFMVFDGTITRTGPDFQNAQAVSFKTYRLNIALDDFLDSSQKDSKDKHEMTLQELHHKMQSAARHSDYRYSIEFYQRLALPASCFLLGLIGAPLGAIFRQRGRMTGITLGMGTFLLYYILFSAGRGFGENGTIPPIVAIWLPNLLTFVGALYLWTRMQREAPFRLWSLRLKDSIRLRPAGKLPTLRSRDKN